jgi:hypothetical protein
MEMVVVVVVVMLLLLLGRGGRGGVGTTTEQPSLSPPLGHGRTPVVIVGIIMGLSSYVVRIGIVDTGALVRAFFWVDVGIVGVVLLRGAVVAVVGRRATVGLS